MSLSDWTLEILSDLGGEILLFGLASLVYISFAYFRPLPMPSPQKVPAQRGAAQEKRRQGWSGTHATSARKDSAKVASTEGGDVCGPQCVHEIRVCSKSKDLAAAIAAFEKHVRSGGTATSLLYKAIMDACVECGKV